MPPLLMPVAYTREASMLTFFVTSATAAVINATSSMCSRPGLPQQPPPLTFQARLAAVGIGDDEPRRVGQWIPAVRSFGLFGPAEATVQHDDQPRRRGQPRRLVQPINPILSTDADGVDAGALDEARRWLWMQDCTTRDNQHDAQEHRDPTKHLSRSSSPAGTRCRLCAPRRRSRRSPAHPRP